LKRKWVKSATLKAAMAAGFVFAMAHPAAWGQLAFPSGNSSQSAPNPLTDTTVNPGKILLYNLESQFAKDVAAKGGAAFALWAAPDAVMLGNGAAPVVGRVAIEKAANWLPNNYQLTWTPTDAMMGPSGDMGYTWGHFEGRSKDANGNPVETSGRYMTIWRKEPDGSWKFVMDAGANDAPQAGDCCKLPGH
jgi:ketosteroid isomerase-like protein